MAQKKPPIEQIREYLGQLTPRTRGRLLTEAERLQMCGDDMTGFEVILAELRAEFRKDQTNDRVDHASRYFFQPLEPILAENSPERMNFGQIARGSLAPIWEWINQDLLPTMARDYNNTMKQALAANNPREAQQVAAAFQNKVGKYLESTLAVADAADRARAALAMYTSSRAAFTDLTKMLCVLRAADALAEFKKALPARIDKFEDEKITELRVRLDAFRTKYADAMPFALTMVARRLKTPWQLIRFATKTARSKTATDIAAAPYAIAVSMVLEQLDDRRLALRHALRANRIPIAKDILTEIYNIERTLQDSIDLLDDSEWGRQLAELMEVIAAMLEAELRTLPGNLQHVLGSRSLRGHGSLTDRLANLASKGRDALTGGASYCKKLVSKS
jgi:hypothetical protein